MRMRRRPEALFSSGILLALARACRRPFSNSSKRRKNDSPVVLWSSVLAVCGLVGARVQLNEGLVTLGPQNPEHPYPGNEAGGREDREGRLCCLGACRRNDPTSISTGSKRIGEAEIFEPEPNARSRFRSHAVETHYSDTLLALPAKSGGFQWIAAYTLGLLHR
jgi:hypothetical protein